MSGRVAFASEKINVNADDIISLTKETYTPKGPVPQTISAMITFQDVSVRFMVTGENPSRTFGHQAGHGDVLDLESISEVRGFKVLRTNSDNGFLQVTYVR